MKNNVFAQSSVLSDLKKKLAQEQEETRKRTSKYDPNHPDQRYHDGIERSCSDVSNERNGSGFYRGGSPGKPEKNKV